jgi:hypothetical protein
MDADNIFILLHIEIQGEKENDFPLRLFQYYYRVFDQHKIPVLTLAVLTDHNKNWRPYQYQSSVWNKPIIQFNFKTRKLLDSFFLI